MQIQQNLGENKAILRLFELLVDNKVLFFIKFLSVKSPCLSSQSLYIHKYINKEKICKALKK